MQRLVFLRTTHSPRPVPGCAGEVLGGFHFFSSHTVYCAVHVLACMTDHNGKYFRGTPLWYIYTSFRIHCVFKVFFRRLAVDAHTTMYTVPPMGEFLKQVIHDEVSRGNWKIFGGREKDKRVATILEMPTVPPTEGNRNIENSTSKESFMGGYQCQELV